MELGKYYTTVNVLFSPLFQLFTVKHLHKTKVLGLNG